MDFDFGLWDEEENEPELIFPYEAMGSPYPPPPVSPNSELEMDVTGDRARRVAQEESVWAQRWHEEAVRARAVEEAVRARVDEERPSEAIVVLAVCGEFQPLKPIMPPKTLKRKDVNRMVQKQVAEAIAEYEKNRTNPKNVGGSRGNAEDAEGVITPHVHGCSYKTFLNCKPHSFNGTEGVVGLKHWFEKMEQVFEISTCAEEDEVKFAACTFEGRALTW
ncbi:hypothetical protein Tco_1285436 [Tanacetum coccineum]